MLNRAHTSPGRDRLLLLIALALIWVSPSTVHAQEWIANKSYTEGIGIKLGSAMVLHLGLGAEAGYDSNVYYDNSALTGAARLRIVPSIALATLPPQRLKMGEGGLTGKKPMVEFRFGFAGIYEDWFGKTESLNDRRDFGIQTDLGLVINPFGKWRFKLTDEFIRSIRPPNGEGIRNYTVDNNVAGAGLHFVPGEALDFGIDYRYTINMYELKMLQTAGNWQKHDIDVNLKWKFLPKTAIVFSGVVSPYQRWAKEYNTGAYRFPLSNSVNLEAWIGLVGLFTPKFGIAASVGYGGAFFERGDDFDSVIAKVELRFYATPMSAIRLGFIRDIRPSFFTNYYVRNEGYASYEQLIAGKVLLSARVRLGAWQYATLYDLGGAGGTLQKSDAFTKNPRVDWPIISAFGFVEYRITDWIAINATFGYTGSFTDTRLQSSIVAGDIPETYQKFEVLGGVRAMY